MTRQAHRTPVKRALIIAIQYTCFKNTVDNLVLYTPHKDARAFRDLLISTYGYEAQNIRVLLDTHKERTLANFGLNPEDDFAPTRDNIIRAMEELVVDAQPGDHFVLHYSGHGDQVNDLSGDERDGMDEILYPSDIRNPFEHNVDNYVLDDDIKRILVDCLPPKSRLVMVFDCCHSGTAGDLLFVDDGRSCPPSPASPRTPPPPSTKRFGIAINRTYHPNFSIQHGHGEGEENIDGRYVTSWSACRDNQVTFEDGKKGSIFGNAFTRALREKPIQGHKELLESLRKQLQIVTAKANQQLEKRGSDTDSPLELFEPPLPQIGSIRKLSDLWATPFDL